MSSEYPTCVACGSVHLTPEATLCTASDPRYDDYYKWVSCDECHAGYIADVREEVNVIPDSDRVTNRGFCCDAAEWRRTLALAKRCPKPGDARCTCVAHKVHPTLGASAWYRSS